MLDLKGERMKRFVFVVAAGAALFLGLAQAGPVEEAKNLFERYMALERAFSPEVADLYADDALIKNKRTYATGPVREITIPASQYKAIIRQAMPLAKARGDTSSYTDVAYSKESNGVRIRAKRFSDLKKYSSPLSLLVGPDTSGQWQIREELSESQP